MTKKTVLWVCIIPAIFLACSMYAFDPDVSYIEAQQLDTEIPTYFTTPMSVMRWAANYMEYTADTEQFDSKDYWQTPEEVLKNKKGDCEDLAILWMYACDLRLGIRPTLDIYYFDAPSGRKWHAVGQYLGVVYDASLSPASMNNWTFYYRYSYSVAMDEAMYIRSVK